MRRLFVLLVILSALPIVVAAQDTPDWEISTGLQYTHVPLGGAQNAANNITGPAGLPSINVGNLNMIGGNFEVEENVNSWVGGMIDVSGSYALKHIDLSNAAFAAGLVPKGTLVQATFEPVIFTLAGGPQFHYRKYEHFQPFFRVLFGGAHASLQPNSPTKAVILQLGPPTFETTRNSFAGIIGIGTDYVVRPYLAFRVSADFVRTYLFSGCSNNTSTSICPFPDEHQSNLRIIAGVDFRFGQKR